MDRRAFFNYLPASLLFVAILLSGCGGPKLKLSDDLKSNEETIAAYVPVGTDRDAALTLMTDAGFSCRIESGKRLPLVKGTRQIGDLGPMNVIWCEKNAEDDGKWLVLLVLDEQNKIKNYGVTGGLLNP